MSADTVVKTILNGTGRREWAQDQVAKLKASGCTWFRLSHPIDRPDEMYLEGWIVKPEEQGPHPWEAGT